MFLVLNEEGAVVAWQFTKSTSLEEVKPLLSALKEKIELPENKPLTVYLDNCCQVRRQIKDIFGSDVLDLFHAVQCVSRSMSNRHTLFLSCIQDFTAICFSRQLQSREDLPLVKWIAFPRYSSFVSCRSA